MRVNSPSCRIRSSFTWSCGGDLFRSRRGTGSPVRLLHEAPFFGHGAGEGALHVSEKLRLDEPVGNGPAVHRDELLPVRTLLEWIARATSSLPVPLSPVMSTLLSLDAAWRMIRNTSRISGCPDDALKGVPRFDLRPQCDILLLQPLLFQRARREAGPHRSEWLGDIVVHALLDGVHGRRDGPVGGDDDEECCRTRSPGPCRRTGGRP